MLTIKSKSDIPERSTKQTNFIPTTLSRFRGSISGTMTTTLALGSPLRYSHSEALNLSQQTEQYLRKYGSTGTSFPIPLLSHPDSTEIWITYEKLLLACLRTGDDKAAHLCLEKLVDRFGATNERVMGLRGLYQEAVAQDDSALERIVHEYQEVLAEDPANTVRSSRTPGRKS